MDKPRQRAMTDMTRNEKEIGILLVEDDALDARLVRIMLGDLEWSHVTIRHHALRLSDAIEALRVESFDAVLLDLNLPDSFGIDTLEKMRSVSQRTPIVVQTGLNDLELAQMAVDGGAMDYLVKGEFDGRLLYRTIQFAIKHHTLQRDLRDTQERLRETAEELEVLREETDPGDD
jgi:two-component system, cell cycle response regulator